MSHRKIILAITAFLVLGAGLAVGRLTARLPGPFHEPGAPPSWIVDQLNLTSDQHAQMTAIWDDTKQKMQDLGHQRHDLDMQRDKAVRDLLTDEQKAAYDKIYGDYHAQRGQLDQQRSALMHDADDRSRALLDDTQKAKWDELTKQFLSRHGDHGPGGSGGPGGPGGPPPAPAATQP
jgi:Spy/CpxP family protein refolding chaperone